jgi:hypothetical protein
MHWLLCWREILRLFGYAYWASPDNLTLFTRKSLSSLLNRTAAEAGTWQVTRQLLFGVPVSLVARYLPGEH